MKFKFDTERPFGIEIEAYNVSRERIVAGMQAAGLLCQAQSYNHLDSHVMWKIVSDASIRGANPFELVSPILRGEEGLRAVETAMRVLRELGARVNTTTGMHIHWSIQGMTEPALRHVGYSYNLYFQHFRSLLAASRIGNTYCRNDDPLVYTRSMEWIRRNLGRNAVNYNAIGRHGTIEFRQHQGTLNGTKAVSWIIFTQQFMNNAAARPRGFTTSRRDTTAQGFVRWIGWEGAMMGRSMTSYEQRAVRYVLNRSQLPARMSYN